MLKISREHSDAVNLADQSNLFVLASFGFCTWAINQFHEEREKSECMLKRLFHYGAQSCFHSGSDGDDTSLVLPREFSLTFLIVNNCQGMRNALLFRETIILPHSVLTCYLNQLTNMVQKMLLYFTDFHLNVWERWRQWIEDGKALLERLLFLLEPAFSCSKALLPRECVAFLLRPIFSVHFLHPRVDFLCHNPVTLAALFEFDILIYSSRGFMEHEASPVRPTTKNPSDEMWGGGVVKEKKGLDARAEHIQTKRTVYEEEWSTGDTWLQCSIQSACRAFSCF